MISKSVHTFGDIRPALLEDWFRERYFEARIDISSSGVQNYSLGDLRTLLGIKVEELDAVQFRDSPSTGCADLSEIVKARTAPASGHEVMITHGSSEAIFLAMAALLRPGDQVIAPEPAYQLLSSTVEALGAVPVAWRLPAANGFAPDVDELRRLLTPQTRMVVANFPHNPTGATLDEHSYRDFIEALDSHPAFLLWDGSLSQLTYDAPPLPDPSELLERCVSTCTLSKAYGLPGMRLGWAIAPQLVVRDMVRLRDYVTLNTSPLIEYLATAVLRDAEAVLNPLLRQATVNRGLLMDWAEKYADFVQCPLPRGGVTAFPRFPTLTDTRNVCGELIEKRGVLVVPGDCFGHPDRIRIGFGGPTEELVEGLQELIGAVNRAET